jgi:hypothetical protein
MGVPPKKVMVARLFFFERLFLWMQVGVMSVGLAALAGAVGYLAEQPRGGVVLLVVAAGGLGLLASLAMLLGHVGVLVRLQVSRVASDDERFEPGYYVREQYVADPSEVQRGIEPGTLIGTVAALEPPFEGPDGQQCVAAIPAVSRIGRQGRWSTFWVETPEQRVAVCVEPEILETVRASSWRREAARPRWFRGRAFQPELAPGEDVDWICVREGDLVAIASSRLQWDPPRIHARSPASEPIQADCDDRGDAGDADGVIQADAGGRALPSSSPYRDGTKVATVRLRGLAPDGDAAICVDVISREWTRQWERRGKLEGAILGILRVLGSNLVIFSVLVPGEMLSLGVRVVALFSGLGLVAVGLGGTAANLGWWQARAK